MEGAIVLYPCPGSGHLVSMVELGKLILSNHSSFSISVIIPTAPFEAAATHDYIAAVSAAIPSITFYHLPPVSLPQNAYYTAKEFPAVLYQLCQLNNPNLHETLLAISSRSKIKAFVIDLFCNESLQVSSNLNIPTYYYFTSGANCLSYIIYFPKIHRGLTKNLKDLEDMKINVPGSPSVRAKDMPEPLLDRAKYVYQCFVDSALDMTKSSGIIVNSFELLEERACRALANGECAPGDSMPPVYFIGPVVSEKEKDSEQIHECLSWLDSQPSQSLLFLCFGSLGVFYTEQLKEIAIGLERSGVRFLWVVRTPPPNDETVRKLAETDPSIESFLPEGFSERTKDRGYLVKSWAPQKAILSHDSMGGFVTHCGWNSILEAVCAGVPMLAWPLYAEQKMNKTFLVEEMKIALPVDASDEGLVSAIELEKRVSELMGSDKGKAVRERVKAMKEGAAAAAREGGSSRVALAKLAESFGGVPT
ncbi:anthocyanidin 5,3-O-glucosyltransferase-like [Mangifera indica]|uniref:anthocyanidin 5,3-O-glucosyltransferase-like n=1 Tax=Mangifera indica TaxID=29780 RepID=UPI001CFA455D|nr:anthocyanidin 5,3-O-glucosyltransferase-like [Mangifera indica]